MNINKTFKIKRFLLVFMAFVLVFSAFFFVRVNASEDKVLTDKGDYNYTTVSEVSRELATGATYITNTGYTTRNSTNYDQRVNIFTADVASNSDLKVATWNILNESNTGFKRGALLDIARDYEKHNPGWVVLAGINADQYFPTFGTGIGTNGSFLYVPSAYYGQISNGENWFVSSPYNNPNNIVGFKNDGSAKPFVNGARSVKGFYIHVYDENMNEVGSFPSDGLNKSLGENKTVVLASHINEDKSYTVVNKTSENNIYYVEKADLSYVSNSVDWQSWNDRSTDQFFGKGKISSIVKSVEFKGDGKFAIETSNPELVSLLNVGTYVKVQNEFDDEMQGIEEGIGYHTVQRANGMDNEVANSYNSRAYPRSFVGFDASGKAYLMTCFGDNASPTKGLFAQEFNAVCKKYGITDAWQMDGGGSVTCIARDKNGILDYADACIEASHAKDLTYSGYRYILSGLFIVMKVADSSIEIESKTDSEAVFKVDSSKLASSYKSAKVNIYDGEALVKELVLDISKESNEVKADDLSSNKSYSYELYVSKDGSNYTRTFINGTLNTLKATPIVSELIVLKNDDTLMVYIKYSDIDKATVKMSAVIGSKRTMFEFKDGVGTAKFVGDYSPFDMKLVCECNLDSTNTQRTDVTITPNKAMYSLEAFMDYAIREVKSNINNMFN